VQGRLKEESRDTKERERGEGKGVNGEFKKRVYRTRKGPSLKNNLYDWGGDLRRLSRKRKSGGWFSGGARGLEATWRFRYLHKTQIIESKESA